ncbi:hypothetical protein BXY41_116104 [Lacrimispora xylanisolvens]|uniref:Uncharacterized protein n=1 Tax=Lacrimispora xylanisolvens TaxID=384636 RepID=A0A2S6HJB5_9FIRM|nr:hypothetical protein [Hungatella xylanolytica]PPK77565.1 hypothetical protein BXY41_116104 [Hungatella xylanolytica]
MDDDSIVRITEFIHALKIFITAAKRLKDEDMRYLKQIVKMMEKKMEGN